MARIVGVLRPMPKYDPLFLRFLEPPHLLAALDAFVGNTAILHLHNGFVLPPFPSPEQQVFPNTHHRDFRAC